jgi:ligand-binding SRPBCC domain-containing protein
MKTHSIACEAWLPQSPEEAFPFFAEARNLEAMTPDWLNFRIVSKTPIQMRVGARIDYMLRFKGIPLRWTSEITAWKPPHLFIDEQRRGPYRLWVHTHEFTAQDGGTRCRDDVTYAVPGGSLVNRLLVRKSLKGIFTHRCQALFRHFAVPGLRPARLVSMSFSTE